MLHGEADPMVPPEQAEGFKKEMDTAEVDYTFVGYPGAKHAFTDEAATEKGKKFDMPLEYDAEADEKSWAETVRFLAEVFPAG
ncbi:MAG: dienelactone hydrolase family protein [Myxococcales bacterium]|nr:MAG: dienelactone hydrolase family protein [Myxococcales bacterium]